MTPTPPPGSLAKVQRMDSVLGDVGRRIGLWLAHPHMLTVSSFRGHPAPGLALALILLALCGVVLSLPAGVWTFKCRHHLRSSIRGVLSLTVWRERWKWNRCFRDTDARKIRIEGHPVPKPMYGWPTPSGVTLVMRLDGGMTCEVAQNNADEFAAAMRCRGIAFEPIYHNRGRCFARIIRRDFLARRFPWPWLANETTDFFGPIPVGVDIEGNPVTIDLREKNVLVGGGMGSGKSWWLHTLVAAAVLDVRVRVHILDGKGGSGFAVWEDVVTSFATNDKDDHDKAARIIRDLSERIDQIYAGFRSIKERTINWTRVKVVDLVVVDEFTAFTPIKDMAKNLANIEARGRAAGVIMAMATQRPSSKIVDTDFRELFQYRAAFKSDKAGSKMILGDGVEVDSSEFSGSNPGEMWLLHGGSKLAHCRGYSLTDRDLASLAARAQSLRANSPQRNVQVAGQVMPDTPGSVRSDNPPSPVLVLLPPPPPVPGPVRMTVLRAFRDLGPEVEGSTVREALNMSQATFSHHGKALVTAGYATSAPKARQTPQFPAGGTFRVWSCTEAGDAILSRTDASPTKEAGAQ
jgi:S-DNA-T family DNA segregation ATPase FtsK/SpoIIIE